MIPATTLDPANGFFAVLSGGELIGFRSFGPDGRVPGGAYDDSALDTGGGLRPELTGRGLGRSVIAAGLEFGRQRFAPDAFRVTVASFNTRALRVVTSLGFQRASSFTATAGERRFEILVRGCPDALPLVAERLVAERLNVERRLGEQRVGVVAQDGRLFLVAEAEFRDGADGGQRVIDRVVAAEDDAVDAHLAQDPRELLLSLNESLTSRAACLLVPGRLVQVQAEGMAGRVE